MSGLQWVAAFIPLVTFIAGMLFQTRLESRRHEGALQREREARDAEREARAQQVRREFQVQTLLELQDLLGELGRQATAARTQREREDLPSDRARDLDEELMLTRRRLHVLRSRLEDEDLGLIVLDAIGASALYEAAREVDRISRAHDEMSSAQQAANDRIREFLGELGLLRI